MAGKLQHYFIGMTLLCAVSSTPAMANEPTGLLDGQSFVGLNGEKGHPLDPDENEEIVFENGLFTSISCAPYNFGSSRYSTRVVGNTVHFEAVTESPTHGQIAWQGTVVGDTAEVTFVWTKQRWYWDTRKAYWFRGKRKQ